MSDVEQVRLLTARIAAAEERVAELAQQGEYCHHRERKFQSERDAAEAKLQEIWLAFGCERNPDDFKPEVRTRQWAMTVEMAHQSRVRSGRIYREAQSADAKLIQIRALIDTWSPRASRKIRRILDGRRS